MNDFEQWQSLTAAVIQITRLIAAGTLDESWSAQVGELQQKERDSYRAWNQEIEIESGENAK